MTDFMGSTGGSVIAKIGEMRVTNYAEYGHGDAGFIIEQFTYSAYSNDPPLWVLPAWDERGCGDLSGPFETEAEAEAVLAAHRDI